MLDSTPGGLHSGETPLLQTLGLTKRYGDFLANDSIDIDIWPQQIHALLGENGAGKSTLVKAMYGLIQPSDGEMRWQGEKIAIALGQPDRLKQRRFACMQGVRRWV